MEIVMKRLLQIVVVLALLVSVVGQATAQTIIEQSQDQNQVSGWNVRVVTFLDRNWDGQVDDNEYYVEATGEVSYPGGQQSWTSPGEESLLTVPVGIELKFYDIRPELNTYYCLGGTVVVPEEGQWDVKIPCHIWFNMWLPYTLGA